jgi:hypothetical protein
VYPCTSYNYYNQQRLFSKRLPIGVRYGQVVSFRYVQVVSFRYGQVVSFRYGQVVSFRCGKNLNHKYCWHLRLWRVIYLVSDLRSAASGDICSDMRAGD